MARVNPQQDSDSDYDFKIHIHSSGPDTFLTNAFLVETANSLVAIDAMMTVSDAQGLRARADAIGKPLRAVLITHGHPDHYNGTTDLIRDLEGVEVITTSGVEAVMHRIDDAKEVQWKPVFGDDWPAQRTFPTRLLKDGETWLIDDVPFVVHELGPGESHWDIFWLVGAKTPVAFVGDVVFNGVHSFMNDGHTAQWLKTLDVLEAGLAGVATLYTGHGNAGQPEALIAAQRRYLKHYRNTVRELAKGADHLDDEAKAELSRAMKEILPTNDLDIFITAGADAVAAELAAESAQI